MDCFICGVLYVLIVCLTRLSITRRYSVERVDNSEEEFRKDVGCSGCGLIYTSHHSSLEGLERTSINLSGCSVSRPRLNWILPEENEKRYRVSQDAQ